MSRRIIRADDLVVGNGNYFIAPDNNRTERTAHTGFYALSGGFNRKFHKFIHRSHFNANRSKTQDNNLD
jgi:hypothetical protein